MKSDKPHKNLLFLSIKWNALILLSLVLIVINVYFYQFHRVGLENGFNAERDLVLQRNSAQLSAMLEESSVYLQQLSELLPSFYGIQQHLDNNDMQKVYDTLDKEWSALQIKSDIDTVGFYDMSGRLLKVWGDGTPKKPSFKRLVDNVFENPQNLDQPLKKVYCDFVCRQFLFVPLYADGKQHGIILVGRSIVESIINFSRTSHIDIGLVSLSRHDVSKPFDGNLLNNWNTQVMALSNFGTSFKILKEFSENYSFSELRQVGAVLEINQRSYELKLELLGGANQAYLVFLEDITEPILVIKKAMNETLVTGIIGIILSELALLLVLWTPLSYLRKVSKTIPLLALSNFKIARNSMRMSSTKSLFKDETDILDEAIVDLSDQLESLEQSVEERTNTLASKMQELTVERDFITHLLNTAQVIIVTQNIDGKILLVNQYVENVIGYTDDEVKGKQFFDFFGVVEDQELLLRNMEKVASGDLKRYRKEMSVSRRNGKTCAIEWLHSHIEAAHSSDAVILSVGLDISERKAHEQEIGWLADHDSLTGLYNRRRFNSILKRTLSIANRYNQKVGLLFLDLDNFKQINDTLGHQTGDLLIKSVADSLQLILRESDYIARLGGDEFAIILPNIDVDDAIDVANKINKHLMSIRLPMMDSNHRTSASIGIALYPDHAITSNDFLSNADLAMYQAKSHGRGCWHLFSKEDNVKERIETQLYWRHKIVSSLANDRFELHYQPIMNISNSSVSHFEALIRIREKDGELILPTPFIEVAEKTGLIHDIDHMVLRKAISEIQRQTERGNAMVMAINLSAHSFSDPQLLPLLDRLLNLSKIDPGNIIFEITETAALSDLSGAANLIGKIHDLGCRFALDDFGVGFSSFYYLKELPVDFVKIDGSFIQDLPANRNDQILVKAMAEIAREFGKQTIAEFVQDEETLRILKEYEIDFAQGYHIGRPALMAA